MEYFKPNSQKSLHSTIFYVKTNPKPLISQGPLLLNQIIPDTSNPQPHLSTTWFVDELNSVIIILREFQMSSEDSE